jgi:hypothetical protein
MWKPRHLTTLWASTACYRDSFYRLGLLERLQIQTYLNHAAGRGQEETHSEEEEEEEEEEGGDDDDDDDDDDRVADDNLTSINFTND